MSRVKVYPWWQVASEIAKVGGYDDAALEGLMQAVKQRRADRISQRAHLVQVADDLLRSEAQGWSDALPGALEQAIKRNMAGLIMLGLGRKAAHGHVHDALKYDAQADDEVDDQGRDPLQVAARTDVAQAVWNGLYEGSLPAYYSDGIRMPIDAVRAAGVGLSDVYVEPVSVNVLLKAAVHDELVWTPERAQPESWNGRGISAHAKQEEEILEMLRSKGYDPRKLPTNPPGKGGVRSEVRKALGPAGAWGGTTVFNKAWQRLRDAGEIADE